MLPQSTRRIIGRKQELARLTALLDDPSTRLVTVVGIGGVGKTTLCLEAAQRVASGFADGVTFVSFQSAVAPEIVADRIARSLGFEPDSEGSAADLVVDHLADRELLLLIDNFEVVESARPLLSRIRDGCPGVVMLVSSRRRTQVADEQVFVVEPMAIPAETTPLNLDAAMALDAVQLFADRARLARASFAVTDDNLASLLSICRNLEGIPLAIELAAARVGAIGLAEMASGFASRLDLAADGPADVVHRLRSVAAAIGWGYELLEPEVQAVFRTMAVFDGAFSLAGTRAVISVVHPDSSEQTGGWWISALQALIDAQLIQLVDERRYRMLSTIREFGLRQLNSGGERQDAEVGRYRWCLDLARRSDDALRGDLSPDLLAEVEAELDNIRAAMKWAVGQSTQGDEREMAVRLANAMWPFWSYRGYWSEATDWLERSVVAAGETVSVPIAVACMYAGHGMPGRTENNIVWYERSLQQFRQLGDDQGIAVAIGSLASAHIQAGHADSAVALGQEALDRLIGLDGDRRASIVTSRIILSNALLESGRAAEARTELEAAISLAGEIGSDRSARSAISALARLNRIMGRHSEAISALQAMVEHAVESGDRNAEFRDLVELGLAEIETNDLDAAAVHLRRAIETMLDLNYHEQTMTRALDGAARIAALQGASVEAARLMGATALVRETNAHPIHQLERRQLERERTWLRQRMGPSRFDTEFMIGKGYVRSRAHALALQVTEVGAVAVAEPRIEHRGLLSPREFEALTALVDGKSDKAIGEALGIKTTTARTLVQRVREKLGADNRHEAVAIAVSQGLVRAPAMDLS